MKKIPLNSKKYPHLFALIDDEDFEKVSKFKWYVLDSNKNGKLFYAIRNKIHGTQLLHKFLIDAQPRRLDHINGNGLDCRRTNLRICTLEQNTWNRKFTKNKTGYVGVYKIRHKFQASIRINGRNKSFGYFNTPEEASEARERAAKELFGDFYRKS